MTQHFDYKGFSAQKLEDMCHDNYGMRNVIDKFWPVQAYSMGQFVREYANISADIPINCYSAHGIDYTSTIASHEVNNDAAFYLCYDPSRLAAYKKASRKPAYTIPAPLPWLRTQHKMLKSPTAKGTLAYFQHTTPHINFLENVTEVVGAYIEELALLPENLHPICVCLAMHDIHKGYHHLFLEKNIPVYTVGNVFNNMFYKSFYDLLLNFSYTTSNSIGSYTFYSVEAGIPFILHGKKNLLYNVSDSNIKGGIYGKNPSLIAKNLTSLFKVEPNGITEKQSALVDFFVGKKADVISPKVLNELINKL